MHKFSEELLQFIWQHRLLKPLPLITHAGNAIAVLHTGDLNVNAGPDFSNAKIRINDLVLNGNVEVHIKTSDWLKHKHQYDKNYDTLILHVVYEHDITLPQNEVNHVEVLELKALIDEATLKAYEQICTADYALPCAKQLKTVNELKFIAWLERMAIERLETKVKRVEQLFSAFNNDYAQTFYSLLLRNFGFNVNSEPFELLAKHLPVTLLLKHADNLMQLEALLLGTSGLLDEQFEDRYMQTLQNEFAYLKTKYHLTALKKELFKFSRLRPANFPTVRLAQLAMLVHSNAGLFHNPHQYASYTELKKALHITPQGYWANHYRPDGKASDKALSFGNASIEILIINTFAPFFFFYSKKLAKPEFSEAAIALLNACAFESNVKTKLFAAKKEVLKDAANSQGLIHLHDNYCRKKQCLKCGIAASLLKPA
jgi:hypothetical protein